MTAAPKFDSSCRRLAPDQVIEPSRQRIEDLAADLCIVFARSCRHMKRMVGVRKQFQRGAEAELFAKRSFTARFGGHETARSVLTKPMPRIPVFT